jgi:hypothetical protein
MEDLRVKNDLDERVQKWRFNMEDKKAGMLKKAMGKMKLTSM